MAQPPGNQTGVKFILEKKTCSSQSSEHPVKQQAVSVYVCAHVCSMCVLSSCDCRARTGPSLSVANPRAALTSGFITPATFHVTPGHNRGWERERTRVNGHTEEGVLCSVHLCRDCIMGAWKQTQATLIPRKLQWRQYKVLQGDLSSWKPHDWHPHCCALLGI